MKRILLVFAMLLVFSGTFIFQSCEETPVAFTKYGAFTIPELVAPATGSFLTPTGTTVELKWSSSDIDGDANNWDVYFGQAEEPSKVASGVNTESYTVNVLKGTKYFWRVVGHDANGIPSRSEIWNFEIVDPDAAMKVRMEWSTDVVDAIGIDVPPADEVNLRLKIRKADLSALTTVNTSSFENYTFLNTLADGTYYIATDVYSTKDAGDFNSPVSISISLAFSQRGIQSKKLEFPTVLTNEYVCSTYTVYLAKVVKTGNAFTISSDVTYPSSPYSGSWIGTDGDYDGEVSTFMGCSLQIQGLVFGWMGDFWGEVIIKGGAADIIIDETAGTVTIPDQFYCTTTYNGVKQPDYNISGTGTYDASGAFPVMTINYNLIQDGFDIGQWLVDNGYATVPYFVAHLTTNPDGFGKSYFTKQLLKPLVEKPRR